MSPVYQLGHIDPSDEVVIEIPGEPKSKARARVVRGHAYTDAKTVMHERKVARHIREVVAEPFVAGVAIEAIFYKSNLQRIDVDNLLKAVLDGANGVLWVDDSQVVRVTGQIEFDPDDPRTVVKARPFKTSMPRGTDVDVTKNCARCGTEFVTRIYKSKPDGAKYCSKDCIQTPLADCEHCGKEYRKNSAAQRFCTKDCASEALSVRRKISSARKAAGKSKPNCKRCGTPLKRHNAVLCRPCWLSRGSDGMKNVRKADIIDEQGEAA